MIKFEALAMDAEANDMHTIFFIKEEYQNRHYKNNIWMSTDGSTRNT